VDDVLLRPRAFAQLPSLFEFRPGASKGAPFSLDEYTLSKRGRFCLLLGPSFSLVPTVFVFILLERRDRLRKEGDDTPSEHTSFSAEPLFWSTVFPPMKGLTAYELVYGRIECL
jgi:hypothetical protein